MVKRIGSARCNLTYIAAMVWPTGSGVVKTTRPIANEIARIRAGHFGVRGPAIGPPNSMVVPGGGPGLEHIGSCQVLGPPRVGSKSRPERQTPQTMAKALDMQ